MPKKKKKKQRQSKQKIFFNAADNIFYNTRRTGIADNLKTQFFGQLEQSKDEYFFPVDSVVDVEVNGASYAIKLVRSSIIKRRSAKNAECFRYQVISNTQPPISYRVNGKLLNLVLQTPAVYKKKGNKFVYKKKERVVVIKHYDNNYDAQQKSLNEIDIADAFYRKYDKKRGHATLLQPDSNSATTTDAKHFVEMLDGLSSSELKLDEEEISETYASFKEKKYAVMFFRNLGNALNKVPRNIGFKTELEIAKGCANQVALLHEKMQRVHLDLKPDNFVYTISDDKVEVRLIDFEDTVSHGQQIESLVGTEGYIAPEVMNDVVKGGCVYRASYKADIFSLGKTMQQIFHDNELPEDINDLIASMLNKNPSGRPGIGGVKQLLFSTRKEQPRGKPQKLRYETTSNPHKRKNRHR